MRAQRGNDAIIVLVGNKTDLAAQRAVTTAELEAQAAEQEIMFIETSAKEGFNIKLLFRRLATALPNLESSAAPAPDPQVVDLSACWWLRVLQGEPGCGPSQSERARQVCPHSARMPTASALTTASTHHSSTHHGLHSPS